MGRKAVRLILAAAVLAGSTQIVAHAAELQFVDGERPAPFVDINGVPLSALGAIEVIPDGRTPGIPELKARADAGSAQAMADLAERYLRGDGVEKNPTEGRRLIARASALTLAGTTSEPWRSSACVGICNLFFSALPWELPVTEAYTSWGPDPEALQAHAKQGDVAAMSQLAWAYQQGRIYWGLESDRAQAVYWYRRAASAGSKDALISLGRLNGTSDEALAWYRLAVTARAPGAAAALARFYDGRGDKGDAERAFAQLVKAAREGDPDVMDELAQRHAAGKGTKVDKSAARMWCDRAARELSVAVPGAPTNLGFTFIRSVRKPQCAGW